MPRRERIVIPGLPHHVTQRGGRRQDVFFSNDDRLQYLYLLKDNATRYGAQVLSYCLMTNHVHHLLVPLEQDSLRWTLQMTHKRYADYMNAKMGWSGHLWQQRFYSSPVDRDYLWVTIRYIERNPVEAGIVKHAAEHPWSSAPARCSRIQDAILTKDTHWNTILSQRSNWYDWLEKTDSSALISKLKNCTSRDLPTGSEIFLTELEQTLGFSVRPKKLGRPRKQREREEK